MGKAIFCSFSSLNISNFSYILGLKDNGYGMMPRVEQSLASCLSLEAASSLKVPVLPTKPLRSTSALVGKAYTAVGQAGACLHIFGSVAGIPG